MIRSLFRFILRSAVVVGAVSLFLRLVRRRQDAPNVSTGSARRPPPSTPAAKAAAVKAPPGETPNSPAQAPSSEATATGTDQSSLGGPSPNAAWIAPADGACPATHPVKAKEASGIYHVPGGLSYDRTAPDRCYRDVEAAEADGYRQSKR